MPRQQRTIKKRSPSGKGDFHIEFKNEAQGLAWAAFKQHDVLFMTGVAGTGKTYLACAFAIQQILQREKSRIVLTRPIVESGESLGYLPGEFEDKVDPYMMPMWDCIHKLVGGEGPWRDRVMQSIEIAPLAYMRGRAICNDELIPTPVGMRRMGDIKVGDVVLGSDGSPTNVLAVYPQGEIPVFEITFSDHTKSICCENHLWPTMTLNEKRHNKGYSIKTTKEIMECVKDKYNRKFHRVPLLSAPVQFEKNEVLLDPYLLGILLGDGHIREGAIRISSSDQEILEECEARLPEGCDLKLRKCQDYAIVGIGDMQKYLKQLNLVGSKSHTKFVPDVYKFNSIEVRTELLRGLMDADGWICKHRSGNCRIQYCSTSKKLAKDVMFLIRSLGGLAYCRKREFDENDNHEYNGHIIRHVHPSYVVDMMLQINPFKLSRKSSQFKNNQTMTKMISSIKPVGVRECQCITVDAKDHLFLTNDFLVTHNSFANSVCIFDEAQNATKTQLKLFLTRFEEDSKVIVTGDPTQSDIGGDVALGDVMRRLHGVLGVGMVEFKAQQIVRHPLVAKIIEAIERE